MKRLLNSIVDFTLPSMCLSRQNKQRFHTKADFIEQLQRCQDFISVSLSHANALKLGLLACTLTANQIMNLYIKFRKISSACKMFDEMFEPNVVSYTSLMSGFVNLGQPKTALCLVSKMNRTSVWPNEFTFSTMIKGCSSLADLRTGKTVHARVQGFGLRDNVVVCSSLVDMYGKCNDVEIAKRVFDSMGFRNVVTWTSMIVAYVQNGQGDEALEVFREFNYLLLDRPNQFMLASVISACASLGRLVSGKVTHGAVIRCRYDSSDVVMSALVDMYTKCGEFEYSGKVFERISNPCVISYTSMILSAAKFGLGRLSLQLFEEMIAGRVKPNDVTFVGVLHACSHSGLVDEGINHLNSMDETYGIKPDARHYTCVVDMLGRSGRLDEAYQLAKSIQVDANDGALLWGTLLSTSRLHGRVDIAIEVSKKLIESKQQVAGAYVTLSNTYALTGNWEDIHSLRSEMKRIGIYKEPGCSWVEIKNKTYVFYAGDKSIERESEVVSLLRKLEQEMKKRGHVGENTGLVFVDVEEEAKEEILRMHSERLALGFGLISIPEGITIRIMKNLRMCKECHVAFKLISDIVKRDFVVRDLNRFHHFKNGSCTCGGFW